MIYAASSQGRCLCPAENNVIGGPSKHQRDPKEICDLQSFLKDLGFYFGPVHGKYDGKTIEAIRRFQHKHRLRATGVIDSATWLALGDSVKGHPVSTTLPAGEVRILIETDKLRLTVLINNEPFRSFPIAVGKRQTPSPVGDYRVINKGIWDGGFGTRWIGLNVAWGIYGIHGTNKPWSVGRMESHGCFRMFNRDVETLYRWVKVGTPVHIIGDPFMNPRRLVRGEKGSDVLFLQRRLKQLGYYTYQPDGVFGYGTEKSIKAFQAKERLKVTGQVGWEEYRRLRLFVKD